MRLTGDSKLTADIRVYCDPELKRIAGEAADAAGLPLSEYVVQALAEHLARPDLAKVPRVSMGRPRKPIPVSKGNGSPAKATA